MSTDRPSPQMHEDEVLVDDALVRALLKDQFPDLAGRRLMRITDSGTDNAIFRLDDDLGLRLPRTASSNPARPGAGSSDTPFRSRCCELRHASRSLVDLGHVHPGVNVCAVAFDHDGAGFRL